MKTNIKTQEVRFKLLDSKAYDATRFADVFKLEDFPEATVTRPPRSAAVSPP